ncbi:hypothetical protein SCUP515_03462 [Seiridium cupressi]
MSTNSEKRICDALYEFWSQRASKALLDKWFKTWFTIASQPELKPTSEGLPNLILYYGASFNPPHQAHGRTIKIIYDASVYIAQHLNMHLAGVLVGCSSDKDIVRKTREQNEKHNLHVQPISSDNRLEIWDQGILEEHLGCAIVTRMKDWEEFWDFADYINAIPNAGRDQLASETRGDGNIWEHGRYAIRLARVQKIDDGKQGHNLVFEDSKEEVKSLELKEIPTFQPLYYRDTPGSSQESRPKGDARLAMDLTIMTDVGGQGANWMPAGCKEPRKLHRYSQWMEVYTSQTGEGPIRSIWTCELDFGGQKHGVYYVHTGAAFSDDIDSLEAWPIINNRQLSDAEKIKILRTKGYYSAEGMLPQKLVSVPASENSTETPRTA